MVLAMHKTRENGTSGCADDDISEKVFSASHVNYCSIWIIFQLGFALIGCVYNHGTLESISFIKALLL